MYLFYIDESGNRDPISARSSDWLYVLTAVGIFDQKWHSMEKPINRAKHRLMADVKALHDVQLKLSDCEVKSNWLRQPSERAQHPLFSRLNGAQLTGLVQLYYQQLHACKARVFSVLVDKRAVPHWDFHRIHRESWEALLTTIQKYMRAQNPKHQALMITDHTSKEANQALALHHAGIMDVGTTDNTWLRNVCEMPLFVQSELSVGVQMADLCAYNIYRAFSYRDLEYPYFKDISRAIWSINEPVRLPGRPFSGLQILGNSEELQKLVAQFEKAQAPKESGPGSGY